MYLYISLATVLLVPRTFQAKAPYSTNLIRVADPYSSFAKLLKIFEQSTPPTVGIASNVFLHPSAKIGNKCHIGHFTYIHEDSILGNNKAVFGYPATGYRDYLKAYTLFKQLPK